LLSGCTGKLDTFEKMRLILQAEYDVLRQKGGTFALPGEKALKRKSGLIR
jgi:hypothetical protein